MSPIINKFVDDWMFFALVAGGILFFSDFLTNKFHPFICLMIG